MISELPRATPGEDFEQVSDLEVVVEPGGELPQLLVTIINDELVELSQEFVLYSIRSDMPRIDISRPVNTFSITDDDDCKFMHTM